MHVGRAAALVQGCTVQHVRLSPATRKSPYQKPPARLVRRCSTATVPQSRGPLKLKYAQSAAVNALLETADGEPIANAWLTVTDQAPGRTPEGEA